MSKIQGKGVKNSTEIVSAGGTIADLITDDQIYVSGNSINKTLKQAIIDNNIGGGGVGSVDNLLTQSFDSAQVSEFTQTGLSLVTSPVIQGSKTARLIHQAAATQSFKYVKAVDPKYRGKNLTMSFQVRSSATAGNVTLNIYDETNAANIVLSQSITLGSSTISATTNSNTTLSGISSSDINKLKIGQTITGSGIPTGTTITAISISALTATISQAATASAVVTLKVSDLPQKQSVSFDIPNSCASLSYTITALAESGLPETYVDDVVITLTSSALTSTAVFQTQPDSALRLTTTAGALASTNTACMIFDTIADNIGSDISYSSSLTNGTSFTINTAGIYDISLITSFSLATDFGITKNATGAELTSATWTNKRLISTVSDGNGSNYSTTCAGTFYLNVGDVIRPQATVGRTPSATNAFFTITKINATKQVNISSDQKVDLPSSELRMGAYAGCASTNTRVAKYGSVEKLVGDAFTITNDPALGFSLTMKKSGFLSLSTLVSAAAGNYLSISRNATQFSAEPYAMTVGQNIMGGYNSDSVPMAWSGKCNAGDVFRVHVAAAAAAYVNGANLGSGFNALFQEDKVQVSLSNVLPQFTQSDSSVRVDTANGFGSTNTNVRRFSSVIDNLGTAVSYADSATLGASFTAQEDGLYDISYTDQGTTGSQIVITKNQTSATAGTAILASGSVNGGNSNDYDTIACQPYLLKGDVIRAIASTAANMNSASTQAKFTISKVGKPNLTSVDVTPFVNIQTNLIQSSYISAGAFSSVNVTGSLTSNSSTGIFSYNATTGLYTVLKKARFNLSYANRASGAATTQPEIKINGSTVIYSNTQNSTGYQATTSHNAELNVGNTIEFFSNGSSSANFASILAVAEADQIVSPISSFSSDTASLVYAPSTSYTLSTLANAPVGTFITFTAAAGANTQTQTTTAPTQSVSDMNVNGIQITGRGFNQTSTAAAPSIVAIQIGKGFKGVQVNGYRTTSKTGVVSLDNQIVNANINTGLSLKDYNENTGVLILDAALDRAGSTNNRYFINDDSTNLTLSSCYIVINASKSPTLAAVPQLQPRIAYLSEVQASNTNGGASVATTWTTRTLNTLVDSTGIVTSLASNQFTIPAGTYNVKAFSPQNSTNGHKCRIRNITDGTTLVVGETAYNSTAVSLNCPAGLDGEFTITSSKVLALQYYSVISQGTNGLGIAVNSGEVEVYGRVILTKIK
jgi:hypothetical protein